MTPLLAAAMLAACALPVRAGSLGIVAVLAAASGEGSPVEVGAELTVVPRPKGLAGELALDREPGAGLCASRNDGIEWVSDELFAAEGVAVLQYRAEAGVPEPQAWVGLKSPELGRAERGAEAGGAEAEGAGVTLGAAVEIEGGLRLAPGDTLLLLEALAEEPCLSRKGGGRYYKYLAEVRTPD